MPHKDPVRRKAVQKLWRESHREERRAYFKVLDAARKGRVRKPYDKQRESTKRYREKNAGKVLLWQRNKCAKRRARILETQAETIDYPLILRESKGLCGICKEPFDLFGIEFDHIVPLSRGGTHTRENIQATHSRCNRSKGAKLG